MPLSSFATTCSGPRWGRAGPREDTPTLPLARTDLADAGYNAWQVDPAVAKVPLLRMEMVKRTDMKDFAVLPRRWVVERTFSWLGRNRRLSKDFENLAETLATFVTIASIQLAVRRLARAEVVTPQCNREVRRSRVFRATSRDRRNPHCILYTSGGSG